MGQRATTVVAPLAAIADRESPRLITHDERGNPINRIDYHPAYLEGTCLGLDDRCFITPVLTDHDRFDSDSGRACRCAKLS